MIAKLLIISLLAVEHVLAIETTSALPAPETSFNWTTPEATKNISSNFIITNAIPASNVPPFRLHQDDPISSLPKSELSPQIRVKVKDLGYYPVDRYPSKENNSHQENDKPKAKSKGFIEFEFDMDDEISTSGSSSTNISADQEVIPYSSTLNRILSSLIPRSMADIFKLSYATGPQGSKEKQQMLTNRPTNSIESSSKTITSPQTVRKSSVKRQADSPDSKLSPTLSPLSPTVATTAKAITNISNLVTREDIYDINVAAEVINPEDDKNPINSSSLLREYSNTRNESDYEDYNLNLGEDNFIAPSQEVSKQFVYSSPVEMQDNPELGEKYAKSPFLAPEKQINVQIIQDNLGGYGQKLSFSHSKQLDDIHEEVEKQFNPNDLGAQSEAASRKFLKKYKANLFIRPPSVDAGYQIVPKPKTILPESLLHTYIYSSESSKDPGNFTENNAYIEAVPESANQINEDVQTQSLSKPAPALNTYIFSAGFDRDSHSNAYNKSEFSDWNAQSPSENQEPSEISPPHPPVLNSKLRNNMFDVRGPSNEAESQMYTTAPYNSVWYAKNSVSDSYSRENNSYAASPAGNAYEGNEGAQSQSQAMPASPESRLHTYIFSREYDGDGESDRYSNPDSTRIEDEIDYNYEGDAQTSENQEARKISLQHSNNNIHFRSGPWRDPITQVEIQKSLNIHNKYITEKNGNLIEQHEIYTRPKAGINFGSPQQFQWLKATTPISLSDHPIRVAQPEEPQQSESAVESESIQQQHQPDQQQPSQMQSYSAGQSAEEEKPVAQPPASVENVAPQPYHVEHLVEKYIDRPVHVEHIVEKQVNVPYPVREVVEKIVDRPVPVDKIIDRPVHIPYPVQVDHFIDRPYAVQFPVAVAVPYPVHQYIDRPYAVEKIVDRPIHIRVPYPVERVVEKIVEKHVPVEVERIVEKPVEKIVEKQVDRPFAVKEIVNHAVPVPIPVPVGIPVAVALTTDKNSKRKPEAHTTGTNVNDFLQLVPPSLPAADGQAYGYKTLPENIDILLLDASNFQIPNRWGQPVKRGTKSHYIKRSPEMGRNFRVEYGFKPPIVPSLEIDDKGLPLAS